MSLINCPEYDGSIPEKASFSSARSVRKIPVAFRLKNTFSGVNTTVIVDGTTAGAGESGACFELMLPSGSHTIVTGIHAPGISPTPAGSFVIIVPADASRVEVELKVEISSTGEMTVIISELAVYH